MAQVNRRKISLYDEAKAGLSSLGKQTAIVFLGLLVMLVVTSGSPPAFIISLSVLLGVGFVSWGEKRRLTELAENNPQPSPAPYPPVNANAEKPFVTHDLSRKKKVILHNVSWSDITSLRMNLSDAILSNVDLSNVNLSGANLSGADLSGADLSGADLSYAILRYANLSCANLNFAVMNGAMLQDANMVGIQLYGTSVEGSIFGWNKGITEDLKRDLEQRGAIFVNDGSLSS